MGAPAKGSLTVSPTTVPVATTNQFTFSFRASKFPFNPGSQFTMQIPAGWSGPQTSNPSGPGYVSLTPVLSASTATLSGISGTGPWTISISFSTTQNRGGFDMSYNTAVAPTNAGIYTFAAQIQQSGGTLRPVRSGSPTVTVTNPTKTNTTATLTSTLNPSTYGDMVAFTATVTGGTGIPTGPVTFLQGSVTMGTVFLSASGQATFSTNRFSVPDSPCWITAQYAGDATFNPSVSAVFLQTVNPASLSVSGLAGQNKTYDGATNAAVDFSGAVLSGALSGDDVSLDASLATAGFADPNAGAAKPVSVSGLALLGADSGNYSIDQVAAVTASILRAPLTVSANDTNRFFGDSNPAFSATYSGFVATEDARVLSGSPAFGTPAVPTSPVAGSPYAITVTSGNLAANNYSFVFAPGQLSVLPKPALPQKIVAITKASDGTMSLVCSGDAGQSYLLQACGGMLSSWTTIATNTTDVSGLMTCVDPGTTNWNTRFYRTALP